MSGGLRNRLGESPVAIVEIEKVVFREIIGDVDVGATVEIDVADDHTEAEPFHAAIDAGRRADVHEVAAFVPIQPVAGFRVANQAALAGARSTLGERGAVQQVHIEVAIAVIVEERGLRRVSGEVEAKLVGAIGERAVAVVDVQHVAAVHAEVVDA